jgi:hypothetical protein
MSILWRSLTCSPPIYGPHGYAPGSSRRSTLARLVRRQVRSNGRQRNSLGNGHQHCRNAGGLPKCLVNPQPVWRACVRGSWGRGLQQVREGLDALVVLGVNPVKSLVAQRFLALMLMTGLVEVYALIFGIAGKMLGHAEVPRSAWPRDRR